MCFKFPVSHPQNDFRWPLNWVVMSKWLQRRIISLLKQLVAISWGGGSHQLVQVYMWWGDWNTQKKGTSFFFGFISLGRLGIRGWCVPKSGKKHQWNWWIDQLLEMIGWIKTKVFLGDWVAWRWFFDSYHVWFFCHLFVGSFLRLVPLNMCIYKTYIYIMHMYLNIYRCSINIHIYTGCPPHPLTVTTRIIDYISRLGEL